ncbi:hypothetical protein B0O80DRAFT_407246 [Mortierella sp. GBAus27b]|nr:hypothetical protein B0O80DRAFT_407246 [Mortierella sp. GBAus27b]
MSKEGQSKRTRDEEPEIAPGSKSSVSRGRINSSLHGVQDKTEYQHGAILKVSMKSFVTYESCTFSPGPNLNMIIGPNGTGKSAIVCAIALGLGGNTNLLGRAKDISEFVKHGADKAWIEIVLCNRHGSNVVIKRHITKSNNTSVWKINGENKTQKDVMKKVQSLNIQIDNLCQFLPQDRVSEFAQMTPQELLKETQRAVGGEEMLQDHQKMIELWKDHKNTSSTIQRIQETIETNEKRNAVIEKDVFRFQQREAVLRRVRFLEIWILYAKYGLAKDEYNNVKESRRVYFAMFKQLQEEVGPLEGKRRELERKEKQFDEEKNDLDRQYQRAVQSMKAKGTALEATEGEDEELQKDSDRLHAKSRQRQQAISNLKRRIATQQEEIEAHKSEEQINGEKAELQNKLMDLNDQMTSNREEVATLQNKENEIVLESNQLNAQLVDRTRRLEALDDIRNRRMEQLKIHDSDVVDAIKWLRENRNVFRKHVFEPVCLELNIKDMKFVNAIEHALRSHLKTFVCQTRDDYDVFTREILDKRKLRVNVIAPKQQELDLDNYNPPIPSSQLSQYGFSCYMLDIIDGPPELLAAMCSKAGLHATPIAESSTVDFQAIRDSKRFRRYATTAASYVVSYSRHTGEAMDTAAQLRPAQIFTASVNQEERARLIREVDDIRSALEHNEGRVREMTAKENTLRKAHQELTEKKQNFSLARDELMATLKNYKRHKINLETMKTELEQKMNEPSFEEEEEKIRQALRKLATKRCKLAWDYLQQAKESQKHFALLTRATLKRLHAHAERQAQETECSEKAKQLNEMEDNYTKANEQYDEVKARAKRLLDNAKEEYNTLQPADNEDFQAIGKGIPLEQLEDMIASESAKAALHFTPNQSVMDRYEQRQGEIRASKESLQDNEKKLAKIDAEIEAIRGPWYTKVSSLVAKISEGFSKSFEKIGCAGEVKLGEHEDYDKWCIDILVKFRDSEKLQKLTGQRQSGGERSVSTIMYLMALQGLSNASFRVVDEINQGMDPRNERLMHSQLVEKACASNTAQYFLITPKLLPDLDYHERMKVLCIYNGEWLEGTLNKWAPYIENQLRSKAQRLE